MDLNSPSCPFLGTVGLKIAGSAPIARGFFSVCFLASTYSASVFFLIAAIQAAFSSLDLVVEMWVATEMNVAAVPKTFPQALYRAFVWP